MPNFLGLGQSVDIRIALDGEESRPHEELTNDDGEKSSIPIYCDGQSVSGQVLLGMKRGSKLEHQGIRIELLGFTEYCTDRDGRYEFLSLSQDLARPGILSQPTAYPFEFPHFSKPYERYRGKHIRVRYTLRVVVQRRLTDLTRTRELSVHTFLGCTEPDDGVQMEVGIEGSLHIELQFNKSRYHLHDVVIGKIYFGLVHVKIKNMEVQILKRETIGYGSGAFSDSQTVAKYEIMDGAPVRGESIPIRLFLRPYNLDPTMLDSKKRFFVRYFLNIVILDEEDRRYYKQQEIMLYRQREREQMISLVQKAVNVPTDEAVTKAANGNGNIESSPDSQSIAQSDPVADDSTPKQAADTPEAKSDNVICPNGNHQVTPSVSTQGCDYHQSSPNTTRTSKSMARFEQKPYEASAIEPMLPEADPACLPPSTSSTPEVQHHSVVDDAPATLENSTDQ